MLNWKLLSSMARWKSSSQNSVLLRGAKCHCQVAEFLLHKYKKNLFKVSLELQIHY